MGFSWVNEDWETQFPVWLQMGSEERCSEDRIHQIVRAKCQFLVTINVQVCMDWLNTWSSCTVGAGIMWVADQAMVKIPLTLRLSLGG